MNWQTLYKRSYHRHKGYPAACIVEGASGSWYAGVRIENASFPVTIPAIQAACCYCLSEADIPVRVLSSQEHLEQMDFWLKEFDMELEVTDSLEGISLETSLIQVSGKQVRQKLIELLENAVTPNSDFPVSALLFTDEGVISGVNVEVSDWTKGLCAERVALSKAFAYGITSFQRMAVHTKSGQFCSPCGACRQVVFEHLDDHPLELFHPDGTLSRHYTVDLLPYSFKSNNL